MTPDVVFRHFWLAGVGVICGNAAIWWSRGKVEIARQPELAEGYRSLIRGFLIFGNVPWLVMGAGILFGGVPGVDGYSDPRNGPFVGVFYASLVVVWVLLAYWLFFKAGAEDLIRHPGLLSLPSQNPTVIKVIFLLALTGGVFGLASMLLGYGPAALR
jgi:hypothetical protein